MAMSSLSDPSAKSSTLVEDEGGKQFHRGDFRFEHGSESFLAEEITVPTGLDDTVGVEQ